MTVDHYSRKLCQTLVFLGKHQAWFLSLGRDRLVTGPEICAIMKARTKSSLEFIGIFFRRVVSWTRLWSMNECRRCWNKNKVFVGGDSIMQYPTGMKEAVGSWWHHQWIKKKKKTFPWDFNGYYSDMRFCHQTRNSGLNLNRSFLTTGLFSHMQLATVYCDFSKSWNCSIF